MPWNEALFSPAIIPHHTTQTREREPSAAAAVVVNVLLLFKINERKRHSGRD
jgi:hypothetical protein